jgi:hypothetical protein
MVGLRRGATAGKLSDCRRLVIEMAAESSSKLGGYCNSSPSPEMLIAPPGAPASINANAN